jgi:hypothetical protein
VTVTDAPAVKRTQPAPSEDVESVNPVRTKRSWVWKAGAIAIIIAGALGTAFLYSSSSNSAQVFVVGRDVSRGDTIEQQDLSTLDIAEGQSTAGIPLSDASNVIGKVATVDLPKGSLVTPSSVAAALSIPEGQALVGLSLTPAQLPAQSLVAGDRVAIVLIATDAAAASDSPAITGIVSNTTRDEASGTVIVDVYVSATVAADLTSRASAGAVAIYLTPKEK